ncbi:MAG: hypothetical protein ABI723_23445, partial [Bacteroidia bacterium]
MKKNHYTFAKSLCLTLASVLIYANSFAQNVTINPGAGSYPTLKAAFDAINAGTHTGAVTVSIVGNTVEPLCAILNASGVGSASYTSVVITPSGGARTIAGSDTTTIKLAGADNVTIDGRIAGTGRNLSVLNTSIISTPCAIWLAHGGNLASDSAGAQFNVIRNCEIACGVAQSTSTLATTGILSAGTTRIVNGRNNDNNQYLENRIIKCRIGISLNGGSAVNLNDNNTVSGNIVGPTSFGTDEIGITGILLQFQNLCTVSNNTVQFVGGLFAQTTAGADRVGIAVGTNAWTSTTTTTTTGSNYTVTGNFIHDIIEERTFSAVGILIGTTLSGPKTNNLIANNVLYNIRANGTSGDQTAGIGHAGGPGDKIIFNSISLTGDFDPSGTASSSSSPVVAGISKHIAATADTAVLIKNNSIYLDVNTNTATLLKAAIIAPAVGYVFGSGGLDNNDYYIPNTLNGNVTGVGGTGTTSFTTLALWQGAYTPAQDGASIQADPFYTSITSNLKPVTGSPLVGAGTPVSPVTTDIEGNLRSGSTPTVGAYENTAAPVPDAGITNAVVGIAGQLYGTGNSYSINATVKNFSTISFTVCPVFYTVNGGSAVGPVNTVGPVPGGGTENVTFSGANAFTPGAAGNYTIKVYTQLPSDGNAGNDTITILLSVADPINAYPYVQTFTNPVNWTVSFENVVGTTVLWGLGICTNPFGKVADTAATANCFNGSSGRKEMLRSPLLNLTALAKPVLHFHCAYRSFTDTPPESDTLEVLISTDGGVTYSSATTIYKKDQNSTPSLATRSPQATSYFPDSAIQWRSETIDLSNVAGQNYIIVGFRAISNFGNRIWVDDVIVTESDNTCSNTFNAPGTFSCDAGLSVQMVTANPAISELRTTRHDNQDPPYTLAAPPVALNLTATTNSGAIFTPDYLGKVKWWTVTYTGNDRTNFNAQGFNTFNLSIDLTGLDNIGDKDSVYIMRRVDVLDKWVALNTTRSGNILTASGLKIFCDYAIGTSSTNVTTNAPPVFTAGASTTFSVCENSSNNSINSLLTVNDPDIGQTLTWSIVSGPAHGAANGFNATAASNGGNVTPLGLSYSPANGYSGNDTLLVRVNDGTTSDTISIYIIVNPAPAPSISGNTGLCSGDSTLLDAGAGYNAYEWTTGATTQTIYAYFGGDYTVTVTAANGCTGTASVTVTQHAGAELFCTGSTLNCFGDNNGTASVAVFGSSTYTYLWNTNATSSSISGLTAGTYTVTVTSAFGCTFTCSSVVDQPTPLLVTETHVNATCGLPDGSIDITVTGGTLGNTGYSYFWNDATTNEDRTGISAGTYIVTVTDGNGCTATTPVIITATGSAVCSITGSDFCSNSTTQLCAATNSSYLWSNGSTTQCITVSTGGTYTVTVTDGNGCTGSCSKTVITYAPPTCSISGGNFCNGTSTQLCVNPVPGVPSNTYLWSTSATTQCITVTTGGTYTVTVTDGNGCTSSCSKTVVEYPKPACSISGNDFCSGSSTQLCVNPFPAATTDTYLWSTGVTTQCIAVTAGGTYTVTVTDNNGCTSSCSKTVATFQPPVCNISASVTCTSGQLCATTAVSYLWSNGSTAQCITVTTGGTYTVTITDGNSCTSSCSKSVLFNPPPPCSITGGDFCQGGSTQLCAATNSFYLWSTGATTQCITVAAGGTYTVTVTDNNGCTSSCSKTVATFQPPVCNISASVTCTSGQLCATTAVSYLWSTGSTAQCITVTTGGTYTVTITDGNGCTSSCSKAVLFNPPPPCSISGGDFCLGGSTQLCAATNSFYLWSTGATTQCITVAAGGTYTVTVTDNNGCTSSCSKTVATFQPPVCNI